MSVTSSSFGDHTDTWMVAFQCFLDKFGLIIDKSTILRRIHDKIENLKHIP